MVVPLYISEISPPHLRGSLGAMNQLLVVFGIFLVNALGLPIGMFTDVVHVAPLQGPNLLCIAVDHPHYWKTMMLLSLIFVVCLVAPLLAFGPETPRWLVAHNRANQARKCSRGCARSGSLCTVWLLGTSLQRLRGPKADISTELNELMRRGAPADSDGGYSGRVHWA